MVRPEGRSLKLPSLPIVAFLALAACRPPSGSPLGDAAAPASSESAAPAPACVPDALRSATPLVPYRLPPACRLRGGPSTVVLATPAEAARALDCGDAGAPADLPALVVGQRVLSPATVGIDAYDDGARITIVSRQRGACPGEYPPMPVPATLAFRLPAAPGSKRDLGEATCSQAWRCR